VQRNPEVISIKSFVGIQLHSNWLNACHLRFASNTGFYVANQTLCYNRYRHRFFDQVGHETMHGSKALMKYERPKIKEDMRSFSYFVRDLV
jgi:hypothetical protein